MSQQINLLARERNPVGSALAALALVVLVLMGLLAYDAMLRAETVRLRMRAARSVAERRQRSVMRGSDAVSRIVEGRSCSTGTALSCRVGLSVGGKRSAR